jgi:hypothetical protein
MIEIQLDLAMPGQLILSSVAGVVTYSMNINRSRKIKKCKLESGFGILPW